MHTTHRCSDTRRYRKGKDGRPILRPSLRKASAEKILPEVRGIVSGMKISGKTFLFKEDLARKLNVHVRHVEQCLHVLNREGIVGQAEHRSASDTSRDPWGWGHSASGWTGDVYPIL